MNTSTEADTIATGELKPKRKKHTLRHRVVRLWVLETRNPRSHFEPILQGGPTDDAPIPARPRTRAECPDAWTSRADDMRARGEEVIPPEAENQPGHRLCPWVGCKYHLYLDVTPGGSIKLNHPDIAPGDFERMSATCALDVADRGVSTCEEVSQHMNVTRARIMQIEQEAIGDCAGLMSQRDADDARLALAALDELPEPFSFEPMHEGGGHGPHFQVYKGGVSHHRAK